MPRTTTLLICALVTLCSSMYTPRLDYRLDGVASADAAPAARVPVIVCPTTLGIDTPQTPVAATADVPSTAAHLVGTRPQVALSRSLDPRVSLVTR